MVSIIQSSVETQNILKAFPGLIVSISMDKIWEAGITNLIEIWLNIVK